MRVPNAIACLLSLSLIGLPAAAEVFAPPDLWFTSLEHPDMRGDSLEGSVCMANGEMPGQTGGVCVNSQGSPSLWTGFTSLKNSVGRLPSTEAA